MSLTTEQKFVGVGMSIGGLGGLIFGIPTGGVTAYATTGLGYTVGGAMGKGCYWIYSIVEEGRSGFRQSAQPIQRALQDGARAVEEFRGAAQEANQTVSAFKACVEKIADFGQLLNGGAGVCLGSAVAVVGGLGFKAVSWLEIEKNFPKAAQFDEGFKGAALAVAAMGVCFVALSLVRARFSKN